MSGLKVLGPLEPKKTLKRKKVGTYVDCGEQDGVVERVPSKLEKDQRRRIEKEKKDESKHRERDKSVKGKEKELDGLQRVPLKRRSARRENKLICKQPQGGEGGETLHGQSASPIKGKECEREKKDPEAEIQMEQEPEREQGRDREVFRSQKDGACQKALSPLHKRKTSNKPISELDCSNWESCTPSYRLVKDNPKPISRYSTELSRSVLNDTCLFVASGSKDYSSKHMGKNQYEESLFQCEEDHFELDMLIERAAAAAQRVMKMVDASQDPEQVYASVMDEQLSAINLRCIEQIYGEGGPHVSDLVKKDSSNALPLIAHRLKQKHDEWIHCREEINKVWAEVYSKYYHKSLDHRSFAFKQQDEELEHQEFDDRDQ